MIFAWRIAVVNGIGRRRSTADRRPHARKTSAFESRFRSIYSHALFVAYLATLE